MSNTYTAANSALRVCIDRIDGGSLSGQLYSQRLKRPMAFSDLGSLILGLDGLFDQQNYPQAFQRTRSFGVSRRSCPEAAGPEDGMPQEAVRQARGEIFTFDLYVITRRNSTWQGLLVWPDGSREEFDSALEILHLLDEHLPAEK